MKKSITIKMSYEDVCKEICNKMRSAFGIKLDKKNISNGIKFFPSGGFYGVEDNLEEVSIIVKKVNNCSTNICIEFDDKCQRIMFDPTREFAATKAYSIFEKIYNYLKLESEVRL